MRNTAWNGYAQNQPMQWMVGGMITRNKVMRAARPKGESLRRRRASFLLGIISAELQAPVAAAGRYIVSRCDGIVTGETLKLYLSAETTSVLRDPICIRQTPLIRYKKELDERISFLKADAESDPDVANMSDQSLNSFEAFWALSSDMKLKLPDITLTPDGDLYARWSTTEGNVFSVHFLAGNNVKAILFTPVAATPGQKIRRLFRPMPIHALLGSTISREEIAWACQ